MINYILLIVVFIVTMLGCFLYYHSKLKLVNQIDNEINEENIRLQQKKEILQNEIETLQNDVISWKFKLDIAQNDIDEQIAIYKDKKYSIANKELQDSIACLQGIYNEEIKKYNDEYRKTMYEASSELNKLINSKSENLKSIDNKIQEQKSIINAIIADNKRRFEQENNQQFYMLILSDQDKQEIAKLREITPYLRNPEPLNKVIWKVYYEKPYTDLIGRVVGSGAHTGIYKITNIRNNMCYVGQAVNIADRWKTHIKRGIGAEPLVNNKLYPAMLSFGVENFTFEIIEECERSQLNEKEDYWQDYFGAKEFGYSIR